MQHDVMILMMFRSIYTCRINFHPAFRPAVFGFLPTHVCLRVSQNDIKGGAGVEPGLREVRMRVHAPLACAANSIINKCALIRVHAHCSIYRAH